MSTPEEHQRLIDDMSYDEEEASDNITLRPKSQNSEYDQKELNNYEEALSKIGFGRFHFLILFVCGLANASDAVEILCVSFILPAAECDLNLASSDKGYLSACTFLGMMIGGYIWGSISDIFGRRLILVFALLFNVFFAVLCGLSQSFIALIIFRFFSGVGVGGSIPIVWSFFTEFMPKSIRGRMLCCLASAWVFGNLLVVFFAYLIIGHNKFYWSFFSGAIIINNWRLFMIVCALPSFIAAILILCLPESPKFYLYNFKYAETQKVLQYVYLFNNKINTAQDIDRKWKTFKFFEKLKHRPIITPNDYVRSRDTQTARNFFESCIINVKSVLKQTFSLFKAPYTGNTIVVLIVMFSLMFGYYGLWCWLPELFDRMSRFGGTPCKPENNFNHTIIVNRTCNVDNSVFMSSFISALSNVPGNVLTIIYIDKLGRNTITIVSLILSGLSVMGITLISTQAQGVILITIFGAINTLTFNSFGCTCTELYPTTLRSTALGVQYIAGRTGAILGNILFGLAVDIKCYIPLGTISVVMILSGLLAIKLPESAKADIH